MTTGHCGARHGEQPRSVGHSGVPAWLQRVADAPDHKIELLERTAHLPRGRASAVLMLFGPGDRVPSTSPDRGRRPTPTEGATVVLTERAHTLRKHPGQVSFPGGGVDPTDNGPVDCALREAEEEVGIRRDSVEIVGLLPQLPLSVTGFSVTPVLGWWREPHAITKVDPGEVERALVMPIEDLLDPAHRFTAVHPAREFAAPAFEVGDVYVWGFTAIVLSEFFDVAGLTVAWDQDDQRTVPERFWR